MHFFGLRSLGFSRCFERKHFGASLWLRRRWFASGRLFRCFLDSVWTGLGRWVSTCSWSSPKTRCHQFWSRHCSYFVSCYRLNWQYFCNKTMRLAICKKKTNTLVVKIIFATVSRTGFSLIAHRDTFRTPIDFLCVVFLATKKLSLRTSSYADYHKQLLVFFIPIL